MRLIIFVIASLIFFFPTWVNAKPLTIEITQGVEDAMPVAVVPFESQGQRKPKEDIAGIVSSDLKRSGQFRPLSDKDMLSTPATPEKVKYQNWRILGVEALVIGQIKHTGADKYDVHFWLLDVYKAKQLVAFKISTSEAALRTAAHKISDIVYEQLTGVKGAFSSRIAYITAEGVGRDQKFTLWVADSDTANAQPILKSGEPIISPAWSPDGKRIAYTTQEDRGMARISIHEWASTKTDKRTNVETVYSGKYPHGAPSWSPKGDKLAFSVSRLGNTDIYTLELKTKKLRKLTTHFAIDTEPTWTPDGKTIIFTSDRGGRPQLYKVSSEGGRAKRLTFEGKENARATVSPDGKLIAMVHRGERGDQIATLELETGALQILTDGRFDESPSFAPNGSMIIYATTSGNRGELAAVSVDGRIKQSWSYQKDVREPSWSPLNN